MVLEWKEITHLEDGLLKKAFSLYHTCFPKYVREEEEVFYESIRQIENNLPNRYHFLVGLLDDKVVCMATAHYMAETNCGYIVYIATDPEVRGKGLGKKTLLKMEELLSDDAKKAGRSSLLGISLETEREIDAKNEEEYEETINRLQFFQHLGFSPVKHHYYVQPPLYKDQIPVPLYLAFKPLTDNQEIDFQQLTKAMYYEKYYKMNKIPLPVLKNCMRSQEKSFK